MAAITTTTHAEFLADVWIKKALVAWNNKAIAVKRVLNFSKEVAKFGDVINVTRIENLTTNGVGSGGTYSGQANTNTAYTISVNLWREASVQLDDSVVMQSVEDLAAAYSPKIAEALELYAEDQVLGLYSGLSTQIGTSGVAVTDDLLLNAIQTLDENNAPLEDRTFIFRPASKRTLMKIDKFVDADKTGLTKGAQVNGLFGTIYGIPIFFSQQVNSSSGIHNLLFHKEAFGVAWSGGGIKMERFRVDLSDDVVGSILFGRAELRDDSTMGVGAVDILT